MYVHPPGTGGGVEQVMFAVHPGKVPEKSEVNQSVKQLPVLVMGGMAPVPVYPASIGELVPGPSWIVRKS